MKVPAKAAPEAPLPSLVGPKHNYIPPQCYAKLKGPKGEMRNPCYVCHQNGKSPNFIRDGDLQFSYDFPEKAQKLSAPNLLKPAAPVKRTDAELAAYVGKSNYFGPKGEIKLAARLQPGALPASWDKNGNGKWDGVIPDAHFHFDKRGFDRDRAGKLTGWRVYAYAPLPGEFWPSNGGGVGDALIRLPKEFRQGNDGRPSLAVYRMNLDIVRANIMRRDIPIKPTDEKALGVDLDGDGKLAQAKQIAFRFNPKKGERMLFVGKAGKLQKAKKLTMAAGLYPEGTEFLHSIRYLQTQGSKITGAPRMRELRYARKQRYLTYGQLEQRNAHEELEARKAPERLESFRVHQEKGVANGKGWVFHGFIEDKQGELRPQTLGETRFCAGCHGGIGTTTDSIFSFGRLPESWTFHGGYFHFSQKSLNELGEPKGVDGKGEYASYLQRSQGSDFANNPELQKRFFGADGKPMRGAFRRLKQDISVALLPSPGRARELTRAYLSHVQAQDFALGRGGRLVAPKRLVFAEIITGTPTGIKKKVPF